MTSILHVVLSKFGFKCHTDREIVDYLSSYLLVARAHVCVCVCVQTCLAVKSRASEPHRLGRPWPPHFFGGFFYFFLAHCNKAR